MATRIHIPRSLQIGEALAAALGFGISTMTVLARLYTRIILTKSMKIEDCMFFDLVIKGRTEPKY